MSTYFIVLMRDDGFQGDEYDSEPPASSAKEWLKENGPLCRVMNTTMIGVAHVTQAAAEAIFEAPAFEKQEEL